MNGQTIAVLRGGPSAEYDISMQTGAGVLEALKENGFTVRDVTITKNGEWLYDGFSHAPEKALFGVDVVFIALHGTYGEDGQVQRLLERLDIPYTGSKPFASALAMNKALAKDHLREVGIKMPKHIRVNKEASRDLQRVVENITTLFGPEYFVKPVDGGSSIDTALARNSVELLSLLRQLLQKYDAILVEERVVGREATVGVLENFRGEKHYLMPVVEILPPAKSDFFSADVKYTGETTEICPGNFTSAQRTELQQAAKHIHSVLDLRHYSRSDFIVTPDGPYFLEVNTLPGLTNESLFPKSMAAVGGSYGDLVKHLLYLART